MNPRCGDAAGLTPALGRTGDGCACVGGAGGGTVLEPDVSSAIILRIEARISSMLGSTLGSNLDILVPSRDGDARVQGPENFAGLAIVPATILNRIICSDRKYGGRLHNGRQRSRYQLSPERGTLKAAIAHYRAETSQNEPKTGCGKPRRAPPI
ncbi:hypothetical protein HYPDE_29258 [Hyphomicrobium denitrificans 1NES1]|uniref:Uncharacterized protein n=1 Tax=Hyphomicrobium denitrificans 1NES1 TaxID=670307 RepID=N0B5Q1_9HYPH|nr:hypothetical protein HYPDE_29258 [Hyphomicrobium denitrificans 1NES1]